MILLIWLLIRAGGHSVYSVEISMLIVITSISIWGFSLAFFPLRLKKNLSYALLCVDICVQMLVPVETIKMLLKSWVVTQRGC